MSSALERLTYLLGICVAVLSWAVTQLSATLATENVLGYTTSEESINSGESKFDFHLENLSKSHSPARIDITVVGIPVVGSAQSCIKSFGYELTDIALFVKEDPATDQDRKGAERISIENMPPGTSLRIYANHDPKCRAVPQLNVTPAAGDHVRILKSGIESFIIKSQFGILVFLIVAFSFVFIATYATSFWISLRKTT